MDNDKRDGKKFISEKIVGRNLTGSRAVKYLALSVLCAVVFGVIAALVFVNVSKGLNRKAEAETKAAATAGGIGTLKESSAGSESVEAEAGTAGSGENSTGIHEGETASADGSGADKTEAKSGEQGVSGAEGAEPDKTDAKNNESEVSGAEAPDNKGAGTKGTDAKVKGAETENAEGKGAGVKDPEAKGTGVKGAEAEDSETKSAGYKDAGAKGTETKGAEAKDDSGDMEGGKTASDRSGRSSDADKAGTDGSDPDGTDPAGSGPEDESILVYSPYGSLNIDRVVGRYIAEINAVTDESTWFDQTVESTQSFAGLIVGVSDTEILLLAPYTAVESGDRITAAFADGTSKEAVIKQRAERDGLVMLAVSTDGIGADFAENVEPIAFGDAESLAAGNPIFTIGAPLGRVHSYGFGIIGYINKGEQAVDGEKDAMYADVTTDAAMGTYVVNDRGELVGIAEPEENGAKASRIVCINCLEELIDSLRAGENLPYFGIKGQPVSFDMKYRGIPEGVYVSDVEGTSPAHESGIKRGDIISEINGKAVRSMADFEKAVRGTQIGEGMEVLIKRNAGESEFKDINVDVVMGTR